MADDDSNDTLITVLIIVAAVLLCLVGTLLFARGGSNKYKPDLAGKVIIVTGSNAGIGFTTTLELAKLGPKTLIMACRSEARALAAIADIRSKLAQSGNAVHTEKVEIVFEKLDLGDLNSVKAFSASIHSKYDKVDVLINNAGVLMPEKQLSKQGHEMMFQANHLGPFLLTKLLLDLIKKSDEGRIVNVGSEAYKVCGGSIDMEDLNSDKNFVSFPAYGMSKFCTVLYTRQMDMDLKAEGVTNVKICLLHPGGVRTEIFKNVFKDKPVKKCLCYSFCGPCFLGIFYICFKSPLQGAQTSLQCALIDYDKLESGAYYKDCATQKVTPLKSDWKEQAKTLNEKCNAMVAEFEK